MMNVASQQIRELLHSQLEVWEQAKTNYTALESVESKDLSLGECTFRVQFNPARIQSSAAKVDAKSIQERKCFLCPDNLPAIQKGIPWGNNYQILVNPFPIFPEHFTVPTYQHTDQLILDRYEDMLDLAKSLPEYTVFYNGPKCGASAPDHAHFQVGIKGFLPIENDIKHINKAAIYKSDGIDVYAITEDVRNFFLIEAENKEKAASFFKKMYALLDIKEGEKEPMLNIITWYEGSKWYSCIIPREKHRPDCFFAEGDDNLLISPASVDLGGVFITPLEKDFRKIAVNDIETILKEICISEQQMQTIINQIKIG